MASKKLNDFFNGRFFEIPKYQRGFAWEITNVRDLFEDIFESIETESNHYIGTLVLSQNNKEGDHFYIVDGQQRITTLTLILNEIIKHLSKSDCAFYRRFYIAENGRDFRLKILGKDAEYLTSLLIDKIKEPCNKSQRLLKDAYEEIQTIVNKISDKSKFLKSVERLEVMEFIEKSEGDAIRIFQTVNDRGKSLSNMEKAKSLLIYFSNRYLNKQLDDRINYLFGEIFELYDEIKHIGEAEGINLIKSKDFDEDNIMRYHFVAYSDENYDATATYVLSFLKKQLSDIRNSDKKNGFKQLETFITDYIDSLHEFFKAFHRIIKRTQKYEKYYKLFVILGLSATLYPIIVKLEMLKKLTKISSNKIYLDYTLMEILENIEVRVYKTRGTDPRAEISRFAYELNKTWSKKDISEWLSWYSQRWMTKEEFQTNLNGYIYGNRALPHIFIDYCEYLQNRKYKLDELRKIVNKVPTIEHILSKTPKFTYKSVGFKNQEHFLEFEDTLGNLTILEKSLNSAVQNKLPIEKVPYYDKSIFKVTKVLSSRINGNEKFTRSEIEERTKYISEYLLERWSY